MAFVQTLKQNSFVRKFTDKFIFKNLEYAIDVEGSQVTITVNKRFLSPKLSVYFKGNSRIVADDKSTKIIFNIADVEEFSGITKMLRVKDLLGIYYFAAPHLQSEESYNNIKAVTYIGDNIYYLRNEIGGQHRLILQRKIRMNYETPEYQMLIETIAKKNLQTKENIVLIYEKECAKFDEGGSKLFTELMPNENVFAVIDENSPDYLPFKQKYQQQIVAPGEEAYVRLLFEAKYYIGTEHPNHLLTLRSPYKQLRTEVLNPNRHDFIFLQHGVSFGITHVDTNRSFFRKDSIMPAKKVIVSSDLEAMHFQSICGFSPADIWKTGLANYDDKTIGENADKITVMLTWRPWEEQTLDFTKTSYYRDLVAIASQVQDKTKLQIVFHPKLKRAAIEQCPISEYFTSKSIDEVLNDTRLLISDYSSVVFDSFNRGSSVIFWWVEKDWCLSHYQGELLLTAENAFGEIVYDNRQLAASIASNYNGNRRELYVDNFKRIVEFSDNNNTKRIIQRLKQAEII